MTQVVAVLGTFVIILVILKWFKQDTAEMIKIYSESTKAQIEAIEKNVETFKTEMKDFHDRLCAIEERQLKNQGTYEPDNIPVINECDVAAWMSKYPVPKYVEQPYIPPKVGDEEFLASLRKYPVPKY
jgi:hypothetical protein